MKIYLSGPMLGYPNQNHEFFNEIAVKLRSQGMEVLNPAENDNGSTDKPREFYLRMDVQSLLAADTICLLPNWQKSQGAQLELSIAKALRLRIVRYEEGNLKQGADESKTVLAEALQIVNGARMSAYGPPEDCFRETADAWSLITKNKITPRQVALMMILLKVVRDRNEPKRDNLVDIAGYAECAARL